MLQLVCVCVPCVCALDVDVGVASDVDDAVTVTGVCVWFMLLVVCLPF